MALHRSFNLRMLSLYFHMEISWRNRCILWLYILFSKNRDQQPLVRITEGGGGASRILFLLPSEKEHAPIAAHFVKRDMAQETRQIHYVVHENGVPYYSEQIRSHLITYCDKDVYWFGAIKKSSNLNKIKSMEYDAMVDLNQTINVTQILLSLELTIPIKVGFQSPMSEKLYSLVIQRSRSGFLENDYQIIERILGLS